MRTRLIHEPRRDIFYRNSELFHTQATVDRVRRSPLTLLRPADAPTQLVDDIAATLGLGRAALRVVRLALSAPSPPLTSKSARGGKGPLRWLRARRTSPRGRQNLWRGRRRHAHPRRRGRRALRAPLARAMGPRRREGGAPEPARPRGCGIDGTQAVFQTLCALGFAGGGHALGPGIVITVGALSGHARIAAHSAQGKGYADVATRQLLATLADNLPAECARSLPSAMVADGGAACHSRRSSTRTRTGSQSPRCTHAGARRSRTSGGSLRANCAGSGWGWPTSLRTCIGGAEERLLTGSRFGGDGEAVKPLTAQDEKKVWCGWQVEWVAS
jgi:hypothetical protein